MTYAFRSLQRRNPLALVPKKSVTLQAGQQPSVGVAPVSGGSGAGVTASPAGQASPTVAPVPSAGQAGAGVRGTPSEVAEPPAMEAIPLPTMGWMELSAGLVAPTVAGATP